MSKPKLYCRVRRIVQAEPMRADSFLMKHPQGLIDGTRRNDVRWGFEVTDRGKVTWVSREDFDKEFVEVGNDS